ncbi:hypothetical protein V2J09_015672 [Rumex salicifolius]
MLCHPAAAVAATFILVVGVVIFPGVANARAPFACDPKHPATAGFTFCRTDLPAAQRVADLIGRMTVPEKVKLLVSGAAAVPRLGIKQYEWWSEALHGVSNVGPGTKFGGKFPGATSFPQVISTVASFNASLWEEIGRVVSDEARAMYNGGMAGLTYWSPNVNIFRDPRWGRGQETPGEDPVVAAQYAVRYVRGLQGNRAGGDRLKVAACCKHYTAYDLDNWSGVASVMCSYNKVNGVPTCADPNLLRTTIRGEWNLNGYIVSDCDSVDVFYNNQHYTSTPEEAAADAIKAGLDLDCGAFLGIHTEDAMRKGLLTEADVNNALTNTLTVQMRLGMFDGRPSAHPYGHLGPNHVCSPTHKELALDAARQGIVLLKNHGPTLPLSHIRHRTVAAIGPNSDATVTMIGNYAGIACEYTSPLQGISKYAKTIHQQGCPDVGCNTAQMFGPAVDAARQADATVLVMGLDQSIEAEFRDRAGLLLPGHQQELITQVALASKGPVVIVLMSGGPVDITFAKNDPKIGAILWAGYPGQAGGMAIADVLYATANPGGKLPMTWYPQEYLNNLPMTAMALRPSKGYPGRTYRFYKGPIVYPFGHGLSYTKFDHSIVEAPTVVAIPLDGRRLQGQTNTTEAIDSANKKAIRVSRTKCGKLSVVVHVDVRNTGRRDGTHTLMVFATPPGSETGGWGPHRQLVSFEKVVVPTGETRRVRMDIRVCKQLSVVDRNGVRRIPFGEHHIHIGSVKHSILLHAAANLGD